MKRIGAPWRQGAPGPPANIKEEEGIMADNMTHVDILDQSLKEVSEEYQEVLALTTAGRIPERKGLRLMDALMRQETRIICEIYRCAKA